MNDDLGEVLETIEESEEADSLITKYVEEPEDKEEEEEDSRTSSSLSSSRPSVNLDADDPAMDIEPVSTKITHCKTCGNRINPMVSIQGECPRCAMKRMREIESRLIKLKQINPDNKYCVLDAHGVAYKNPLDPNYNKITVMGVDFYPPGDLCMQCMTNLRTYFTKFLEDRGITRKGNGHEKNVFADTNIKLTVPEQLEQARRFEQFMLSVNAYANDKESGLNEVTKFYIARQRQLLKKEAKAKWHEKENQKSKLAEMSPLLSSIMRNQNENDAQSLRLQERLIQAAIKHGMDYLLKMTLLLNFEEDDPSKLSPLRLQSLVNRQTLHKLPLPNEENGNEEDLHLVRELHKEISYQLGRPYAVYADAYTKVAVQKYNQWISDLASEPARLI